MQYFIVGFSITIIASIIAFSIANKLHCLSPLQSSQTRKLSSSELHYIFVSLRLSFHVCCASHVHFTHIALQTVLFLCCSFFQVKHLHGPFFLCHNVESPHEFNLILWNSLLYYCYKRNHDADRNKPGPFVFAKSSFANRKSFIRHRKTGLDQHKRIVVLAYLIISILEKATQSLCWRAMSCGLCIYVEEFDIDTFVFRSYVKVSKLWKSFFWTYKDAFCTYFFLFSALIKTWWPCLLWIYKGGLYADISFFCVQVMLVDAILSKPLL